MHGRRTNKSCIRRNLSMMNANNAEVVGNLTTTRVNKKKMKIIPETAGPSTTYTWITKAHSSLQLRNPLTSPIHGGNSSKRKRQPLRLFTEDNETNAECVSMLLSTTLKKSAQCTTPVPGTRKYSAIDSLCTAPGTTMAALGPNVIRRAVSSANAREPKSFRHVPTICKGWHFRQGATAVAVDLRRVVQPAGRLIQEEARKECPCVVADSARCTTLRDEDEV